MLKKKLLIAPSVISLLKYVEVGKTNNAFTSYVRNLEFIVTSEIILGRQVTAVGHSAYYDQHHLQHCLYICC